MFGKIWQRVLRSRAPEAYARSIGVKLGKDAGFWMSISRPNPT
jgi:hypothetical protein